MPETCQPQAIVSVQPTVCPIILQIERELALFNPREKLDKTRLPNEWIQRNRDDTMNSSFRGIVTTDQTLRSGNLSTRLNIRANKTCIYLERTLRNHLHRTTLPPLLSNFHLKDFYNKQRRRWKKNKREDERQKENFLFGFFLLPCRIWGRQICWSQTDCRQWLPFLPQNNQRVVVVVVVAAKRNDRERRERTNHQSVRQWKKRSAKP